MNTVTRRRSIVVGLALALSITALSDEVLAQKKYDEGATDTEIKIGNTMPYSGNASAYGRIGRTTEAYFKWINDQGGVNGRKINFITYDDGYSPPKTVEMTRKAVEEDKVLLMFNQLGTPSNTAIHKYMNQKKIPQLFVATGASKWGNPKEFPWTMGWQPDYVTEAKIYAKHIIENVKEPKIAILMQNDDYGKDYFNGFKAGLGASNEKLIVAHVTYEVTDPTVDNQIIQLKNSGANVFFNITTPKFAAQAIKKAAEIGWKPAQYLNNVSTSIGSVIKPAGFEASQGIITAEYRKDVVDPKWANAPDVIEYKKFLDKYVPNADLTDYNNTIGYGFAFTMVHVLKAAGDDLTRANIMKQAANLKGLEVPLLLPGITLKTSPTDFFPIQSIYLQKFEGESWKTFGNLLSAESD